MLWHLKNSDLSNAVSQSPRIPLWHLKSPNLPKAVSQSPRIRLWHLKSRYLPNAVSQSLRIQLTLNSVIRTPSSIGGKTFQGENPGKLPPQNPGKQSQKAHISGRLPKAPEGGLCLTAGAAGQKNRDRPFFGQSLFLEPGKGMCPG